jgi:hypothetical protein
MLTKQVVPVSGERITEVGAEGRVRIPAGVSVIDLSSRVSSLRPRHGI